MLALNDNIRTFILGSRECVRQNEKRFQSSIHVIFNQGLAKLCQNIKFSDLTT